MPVGATQSCWLLDREQLLGFFVGIKFGVKKEKMSPTIENTFDLVVCYNLVSRQPYPYT